MSRRRSTHTPAPWSLLEIVLFLATLTLTGVIINLALFRSLGLIGS